MPIFLFFLFELNKKLLLFLKEKNINEKNVAGSKLGFNFFGFIANTNINQTKQKCRKKTKYIKKKNYYDKSKGKVFLN